MKQLRISLDLRLPAHEAQTQTIVVYGAKGMGKTNFAAVFAEELDDLDRSHHLIENHGRWYRLT